MRMPGTLLMFLELICQSNEFRRQNSLARAFHDVIQFATLAKSDMSHGSTIASNYFKSDFVP